MVLLPCRHAARIRAVACSSRRSPARNTRDRLIFFFFFFFLFFFEGSAVSVRVLMRGLVLVCSAVIECLGGRARRGAARNNRSFGTACVGYSRHGSPPPATGTIPGDGKRRRVKGIYRRRVMLTCRLSLLGSHGVRWQDVVTTHRQGQRGVEMARVLARARKPASGRLSLERSES